MRKLSAAAVVAPLLLAACGGSTPAHDAVQGAETGDYSGISGGDTVPAMDAIGPIDTALPPPDTAPIQRPEPPRPPQ